MLGSHNLLVQIHKPKAPTTEVPTVLGTSLPPDRRGTGSRTREDTKVWGYTGPLEKMAQYLHTTYAHPLIHLKSSLDCLWASLVAQLVKKPPVMQETWVWSLGQEDPLKKETATHTSILAWRIPWTERPGKLQSMGSQKLDTTQRLTHHHQIIYNT